MKTNIEVISETRIAPSSLCPTINGKQYLSHVMFRPVNCVNDADWFSWLVRKDQVTKAVVEQTKKPCIDSIITGINHPWSSRNANIYRDFCAYIGNDADGYFRKKDYVVAADGFMLDFDCHSASDMPLSDIAKILLSADFKKVVPCSKIIFSGNGYQIHIPNRQSFGGDLPQRRNAIQQYEAIILSVMSYCTDFWKLKPDPACKDINRLHRHFPSYNTKKMQSASDDAQRIPVELVFSRMVDHAAVADFVKMTTEKYPSVPANEKRNTVFVAKANDNKVLQLARILEPPCLKKLWETGAPDGKRNATRFAVLSRVHACGLDEDTALKLIHDFNNRCNPPDDVSAVETHVRSFYKDPKQVGCKYMHQTCGICAFGGKSLEDAKKDCSFMQQIHSKRINHPYFIGKSGNMMRKEFRQTKNGMMVEEHLPVTEEGYVTVTAVVQDSNGKHYRGKIVNGKWHMPFELPATLWASRAKFAETIKGLAGEKLMFFSKNAEHVAMASEYLCPDKEIKIVRDFGWDEDFTSFYGVDCIIDKDGIHAPGQEYFRCQHKAAQKLRLCIPKDDAQIVKTIQHIKAELMSFNNYTVMQYVMGVIFSAPFLSLMRKRASTTNAVPSLIVQGTTGIGKSANLILAASFFGQVRDTDVISFSSTPRVVNDLGFWFKDAIYVIDDLKWSSLSKPVQTQVTQILQSYVDGQARNRLSNRGGGDWEPETGKEIRGTVCIAAEDLPTGEASIFGRFMIVNMEGSTTDVDLYRKCLAESKNYSAVMAEFLAWYLSKNDPHAALLAQFDHYRLGFEKDVPRDRINLIRVCSQLSLNMLGYELFLQFAVSKGGFSKYEAGRLLKEHKARLCELRDKRLTQISSETPAEKFLTMVASLISSGKVRLDGDCDDKSNKPVIGFQERDDELGQEVLFLNPQIAYGMVQRAYDDLQERIPFNQYSLGQQLQSQGYLIRKDSDRLTYSKVHNGKKGRYYAIDLTKFDWHVPFKPEPTPEPFPSEGGNTPPPSNLNFDPAEFWKEVR